jgi:hypothetical protein
MDNRGTYIHKHQPSNEYFSTTQSFTNPDESGRTTVHITDRDDYRNYGVREVVHQPPSMATNQVVIQQQTQPIQHRISEQYQRPSSQHGLNQTGITSQTVQVNQTGAPIRTSQVKEGEIIKGNLFRYLGHSRIEYVPFQNRIIDYETREWVEKVPVQRTVT